MLTQAFTPFHKPTNQDFFSANKASKLIHYTADSASGKLSSLTVPSVHGLRCIQCLAMPHGDILTDWNPFWKDQWNI